MKTLSQPSFSRRERGSAFITVVLFSFLLLTLSASVIGWSMSERRFNARSGLWLEARNAAEGVAEYGCYQVARGFSTKMNPTFGTGGTDPVSFSSSMATSLFGGGHVDTSSISLQAGSVRQVPSSGLYYIDPNDPNNKYDPMVGRYCYRRDVTILSKATVRPNSGGSPLTAYIEEKVSVRGAPLLAYAIFYSNNDLEFGETPQMDIYGPVHVNGNLFVGPAGSNPSALSFHGPVTSSGSVFHAWRGTTTTSQEGGTAMSSTTPVNFSTDSSVSGNVVNMRTSGGVWNDSTMGADSSTNGLANLLALVTPARSTSFAQYASQTWHGNLQTAAMDIRAYNPMGFSEVVAHDSTNNVDILATDPAADDGSTVGTGSGYGHGYGPHSLIEPSMALPASTDTYYTAKVAVEQQKFANNAGLYMKVQVDASNNPTITLYGDPRSAPSGTPASNIGPNGGLKLGTVPANLVQFIPYTTNTVSGTTYVTKGMYDQHQSKGYNLLQLDMGKLRTTLADMAGATTTAGTDLLAADNTTKWGSGTTNTGYDQYTPSSTGWNGGVYIDVSSASTNHTGVILANGTVSSGSSLIPDGSASNPAPNNVTGLTLATNAPVYILGSLNTDGTVSSTASSNNSALYPDDYPGTNVTSSKETPLAIAADAVTVLSDNYFGTGGSGGTHLVPTSAMSSGAAYNSYRTAAPAVPSGGSVEVAAALITGTVTTSPDSSGTQMYSGGVHNLPRFLENWSSNSNTVAIRGSMVCMYNSRIATAGWSISYYSAPVRQWGYDQIFANGKFPPIIPRVTSFRRIDFTYLSGATAYATEQSNL